MNGAGRTFTPRRGAIDIASVFFFVGVVTVGFGAAMLLPALLDLIDGNLDYAVFLTSAGIAIFAGLSLALACHRSQPSLGRREVTLAVSATWLFAVIVGALPFKFSEFGLGHHASERNSRAAARRCVSSKRRRRDPSAPHGSGILYRR